jgi:hypothetical protein
MRLTDAETAYLRRFCFEVWYRLDGPGSTVDECKGHYYDLADLATPTIQREVGEDIQFEPDYTQKEADYPKVPFPWESLEALHLRALEIQPELEAMRARLEPATP